MRDQIDSDLLNAFNETNWEVITFSAVVGWSGAIWVWCSLCCAYSTTAALSVVIGMFDTWEWTPLMGFLDDAWSVRQMWR